MKLDIWIEIPFVGSWSINLHGLYQAISLKIIFFLLLEWMEKLHFFELVKGAIWVYNFIAFRIKAKEL